MSINWLDLLEKLLYVVLSVCVPIVIKFLYPIAKTKAQELSERVKDETAQRYLSFALDAVIDSVAYVTQTYVETLKKNGEFTEESGKEAFNRAKERALQLMTDDVKEFIAMTYGDINLWLQTKIEAEVKAQKSGVLTGIELEPIE